MIDPELLSEAERTEVLPASILVKAEYFPGERGTLNWSAGAGGGDDVTMMSAGLRSHRTTV